MELKWVCLHKFKFVLPHLNKARRGPSKGFFMLEYVLCNYPFENADLARLDL